MPELFSDCHKKFMACTEYYQPSYPPRAQARLKCGYPQGQPAYRLALLDPRRLTILRKGFGWRGGDGGLKMISGISFSLFYSGGQMYV